MKKWLNAIERHLYKYNIPPIMKYLVFAMGGVFVLDLLMVMTTAYTTHFNLISYLTLDIPMVLQGQVWRLVTWLIVPNHAWDYANKKSNNRIINCIPERIQFIFIRVYNKICFVVILKSS